jgi:hypothetical protein
MYRNLIRDRGKPHAPHRMRLGFAGYLFLWWALGQRDMNLSKKRHTLKNDVKMRGTFDVFWLLRCLGELEERRDTSWKTGKERRPDT